MSTMWAFDRIENKHTLYYRKDYMKIFCESLREHAKNIFDFEKKKKFTVNKRRTNIASRCKRILYLREKNLKKDL